MMTIGRIRGIPAGPARLLGLLVVLGTPLPGNAQEQDVDEVIVSARKRGSKLAWEIDCLINATDADNIVLMSLLDQVTAAAGKSGALKVSASRVITATLCNVER